MHCTKSSIGIHVWSKRGNNVRKNSLEYKGRVRRRTHILYADYANFAQRFLDDSIVTKRDALAVNNSVTALVDQVFDRLEGRCAPHNEWRDDGEHLGNDVVVPQKYAAVHGTQPQPLESLQCLRPKCGTPYKSSARVMSESATEVAGKPEASPAQVSERTSWCGWRIRGRTISAC